MKTEDLFQEMFAKWDEQQGGTRKFELWLSRNGYRELPSSSIKVVYTNAKYVVKFDAGIQLCDTVCYGINGGHSHTAYEHRIWVYSKHKPQRRQYITPSIAYHRGLLIQPRL